MIKQFSYDQIPKVSFFFPPSQRRFGWKRAWPSWTAGTYLAARCLATPTCPPSSKPSPQPRTSRRPQSSSTSRVSRHGVLKSVIVIMFQVLTLQISHHFTSNELHCCCISCDTNQSSFLHFWRYEVVIVFTIYMIEVSLRCYIPGVRKSSFPHFRYYKSVTTMFQTNGSLILTIFQKLENPSSFLISSATNQSSLS